MAAGVRTDPAQTAGLPDRAIGRDHRAGRRMGLATTLAAPYSPAMNAETNLIATTEARPHALASLLGRLRGATGNRRTRVEDLLVAMGEASFTPVLLIPALVVVSPLSGIPILPTICGLAIALIAAQMMLGRERLWLPRWLRARSMDSARLLRALAWLERPAGWLDAITAERFRWLTAPPLRLLLLATCLLAGLAMPFLELLPFTSSLLAAAITLIATGLLVRDGLLALLGLGLIGGAVAALLWLLL